MLIEASCDSIDCRFGRRFRMVAAAWRTDGGVRSSVSANVTAELAAESSVTYRALEERKVDLAIARMFKPVADEQMDAEVLYATIAMKMLPLKDMAYKHACF